MSDSFEYNGIPVVVTRILGEKELIKIRGGTIHVYAGLFTKREVILEALDKKSNWIQKHINAAKNRIKINFESDGETFILGKRIKVIYSAAKKSSVELIADTLHISGPSTKARQNAYKNFASTLLEALIDRFYGEIHDVGSFNLSFKYYSARWGCCYRDRRDIIMNVWCVGLPEAAIKYVFCHELAHLRVSNHSRDFYNEVRRIWPDYKKGLKISKTFSIA